MAKPPKPKKTLSPEERVDLARADLTYAASLLHKEENRKRLIALPQEDLDELRELVAEVLDLVEMKVGE